jgi:hypothetical protein
MHQHAGRPRPRPARDVRPACGPPLPGPRRVGGCCARGRGDRAPPPPRHLHRSFPPPRGSRAPLPPREGSFAARPTPRHPPQRVRSPRCQRGHLVRLAASATGNPGISALGALQVRLTGPGRAACWRGRRQQSSPRAPGRVCNPQTGLGRCLVAARRLLRPPRRPPCCPLGRHPGRAAASILVGRMCRFQGARVCGAPWGARGCGACRRPAGALARRPGAAAQVPGAPAGPIPGVRPPDGTGAGPGAGRRGSAQPCGADTRPPPPPPTRRARAAGGPTTSAPGACCSTPAAAPC